MIRYLIVLAAFGAIAGAIYVRLVPFDAKRFHLPVFPAVAGDYPTLNGFSAIRELNAESSEVIEKLDQFITGTARTKRMAGLPGMALITYETRSRIFGFPDYTNVSIIEIGTVGNQRPMLAIRGKARFGKSDIGVNKKRIEGWLDALGPLTLAP